MQRSVVELTLVLHSKGKKGETEGGKEGRRDGGGRKGGGKQEDDLKETVLENER